MKRDILVVAPHADDETLGCGGALLRHKAGGDRLHWVIVTSMTARGWSSARRRARAAELRRVAGRYGFASVRELGFPAAGLDAVPRAKLIDRMRAAFSSARPHTLYLPYPGDAHGDHRVAFEAAAACAKWFRLPSLRRVLCYETLSETDAALDPTAEPFRPNVFVDVSEHLERKLAILREYKDELGSFPFPRSEEAVRALAALRGASAGFGAAEAFQLVREAL
jgi:N-acetylglucosamine malate deacetylase 1